MLRNALVKKVLTKKHRFGQTFFNQTFFNIGLVKNGILFDVMNHQIKFLLTSIPHYGTSILS
jgi:hypothetical protein